MSDIFSNLYADIPLDRTRTRDQARRWGARGIPVWLNLLVLLLALTGPTAWAAEKTVDIPATNVNRLINTAGLTGSHFDDYFSTLNNVGNVQRTLVYTAGSTFDTQLKNNVGTNYTITSVKLIVGSSTVLNGYGPYNGGEKTGAGGYDATGAYTVKTAYNTGTVTWTSFNKGGVPGTDYDSTALASGVNSGDTTIWTFDTSLLAGSGGWISNTTSNKGLFFLTEPLNTETLLLTTQGANVIWRIGATAPPGAPTIGTATASAGQISVTFTPPESVGSSAITSYTATCTSSDGGTAGSASGSSSPITVTGLTNGITYSCAVTATNSDGTGPASSASSAVIPLAIPGAPTGLSATPGDGTATIAFTAPSDDGGSAITNYEYSINNGSSWIAFSPAVTSSPVTITGLTNGTTYQVKLRAVNAAGAGTASTVVAVTPPCGPGLPLTTGAGALWQQLALPCIPTTATVQGALGSGATGNLEAGNYNSANYNTKNNWWRLFRYNAATPAYVLPAICDAVNVGTGYWLKNFNAPVGGGNLTVTGTATPTDVTGAACAVAAGCKAIALTVASNRTNLVGNPFPYNVDWSKVRIRVDGSSSTLTPTQAQNAGYLSKQIWIWNGSTYQTWDDVTNPGNLKYFQSFWVKVLPGAVGKTLALLIPAEVSTVSQASPVEALPWYLAWLDWIAAPAQAAPPAAPGDWQVRLVVENWAMGWRDETNLLGQKAESLGGYDAHDLSELAPFGTPYLGLVFPHPDWPNSADGQKRAGDYATDFRPQDRGPTDWLFELRGNPTGGKVSITWQGDPEILKRSRLTDLQTGQTIKPGDRCWAQGYPVTLANTVQRYQWRYLGR